jgi:hypothetical protein
MKNCIKCSALLPLDCFYKHPNMADGRLNKCKQCCCADARNNRRQRLDYYRDYDRKRFHDPSRQLTRAARMVSYRKANPHKDAAHAAVARAVRSGKLARGVCEVCGCGTVDAHHDDYSRPLEVRWLCRVHHLMEHGKYITKRS